MDVIQDFKMDEIIQKPPNMQVSVIEWLSSLAIDHLPVMHLVVGLNPLQGNAWNSQ